MKLLNKKILRKKKLFKLNIFHKSSRTNIIKNKYYSKSQSFNALFHMVQFKNVNFRGAIFTKCNFKSCVFDGVEFWGTNLKKSQFKNSRFKDCVFVGSKLERANFKNAQFINCTFVNMNYSTVKNLNIDMQQNVKLNKYPALILSNNLQHAIIDTQTNKYLSKFKLLFLNNKKINMLNVFLLLKHFSENDLISRLLYSKAKISFDIPTVKSLINFMQHKN